MSVKIDVLGGTHGNELAGTILAFLLESGGYKGAYKIPGVRSRIANGQAASQARRFIGEYEMMGSYPGSRLGGPEEVEAHYTMQWLGKHAGSDEVLIYDIHDNFAQGNTYVAVGQRILKATLAGAYLLGFDKCLVDQTPFFKSVPNAALLEFSAITFPDDYFAIIDELVEGLDELASYQTLDGLRALGSAVCSKICFYKRYAIPTTDQDGELAAYIPELEQVHAPKSFMPIHFSDQVRKALNIPLTADVLTSSWGHHNMSLRMHHLGPTASGGIRREYFGACLIPISPPVSEGKWLLFLDEDENLIDNGLSTS